MATTYKFTWDQGTTISRVLRWKRDGEPVNLSGYSARMEIRDRVGGTLLYRLDSDALGTIQINGPDGEISFEIPAEETETWMWRNAVYDLELVDSENRVTRLIQGTISLSPEVTTGD